MKDQELAVGIVLCNKRYVHTSKQYHVQKDPCLFLLFSIVFVPHGVCFSASLIFIFSNIHGCFYSRRFIWNLVLNCPVQSKSYPYACVEMMAKASFPLHYRFSAVCQTNILNTMKWLVVAFSVFFFCHHTHLYSIKCFLLCVHWEHIFHSTKKHLACLLHISLCVYPFEFLYGICLFVMNNIILEHGKLQKSRKMKKSLWFCYNFVCLVVIFGIVTHLQCTDKEKKHINRLRW